MATDIAKRTTTQKTETTLTTFNAGRVGTNIQVTQKSGCGVFNNIHLSADDARWLASQLTEWANNSDRGV